MTEKGIRESAKDRARPIIAEQQENQLKSPIEVVWVGGRVLPTYDVAARGPLSPAESAIYEALSTLGLELPPGAVGSVSVFEGVSPDAHRYREALKLLFRDKIARLASGLDQIGDWQDEGGTGARLHYAIFRLDTGPGIHATSGGVAERAHEPKGSTSSIPGSDRPRIGDKRQDLADAMIEMLDASNLTNADLSTIQKWISRRLDDSSSNADSEFGGMSMPPALGRGPLGTVSGVPLATVEDVTHSGHRPTTPASSQAPDIALSTSGGHQSTSHTPSSVEALEKESGEAQYAAMKLIVFGSEPVSLKGFRKWLKSLAKLPQISRQDKRRFCKAANYWKKAFDGAFQYQNTFCILTVTLSARGHGVFQLKTSDKNQKLLYSLAAFPPLSFQPPKKNTRQSMPAPGPRQP